MLEFNFISADYAHTLEQLAFWLGNQPVQQVVPFDEFTGRGKVFIVELENGLFIRAWDFNLNDDTRFKLKAVLEKQPLLFTINYLLTPESYLIEVEASRGKSPIPGSRTQNIFLFASDNEFAYVVPARVDARAFEICFTGEWLHQQLPNDGEKVNELLSRTQPDQPYFIHAMESGEFSLIQEMTTSAFQGNWDKIFLRSRVFILLDNLLRKFITKPGTDLTNLPAPAGDMRAVEEYLRGFLQGQLPDIKKMARHFSTSDSTLERQFKNAYGKNIYAYYLAKKMELARILLIERKMTISEVAHALGYEKLSSFSLIFKKHFGKSPALVRKENL